MGSLKDFVDIKKLVITVIVVVFILYCFISGNIGEFGISVRDDLLNTYPVLEALNKVDSEQFDNLYNKFTSEPNYTSAKNELLFSATVWFSNNKDRLLQSASDEAVNEFGRYTIKDVSTMLQIDPTGVYCFNDLYPEVLVNPDVSKFRDAYKKSYFERNHYIPIQLQDACYISPQSGEI